MNKYIEVIMQKMDENLLFATITVSIVVFLALAFMVSAVITKGLTLLAPLLWWGYIVYKEANK